MKDKNLKFWMIGIVLLIIIIGIVIGFVLFNKIHANDGNLTIKLDGVGNAAYDWFYEFDNNIIDVSLTYDDSKCEPYAAGCGADHIYTITPLKEGKVTLTFKIKGMIDDYNKDEVIKTVVYNITVNKDLTINETHYGYDYDGTPIDLD